MIERILWKLAGSLWMLICSAITYNKIGEISLTSLLVMPECLIYLIFGLLHGLLIFISEEIIRNRFRIKENLPEKLISFIADTILYSSFYRLILLPACGFGYIEWTVLLLFFASEFGVHFHVGTRTKNKILEKKTLISLSQEQLYSQSSEKFINPFQLSVLGLILWGFKIIIRYALPQNLYFSLAGNKTIMNLIVILFALVFFYGVKRLKDCILQINVKKDIVKKDEINKKFSGIKLILKILSTFLKQFFLLLSTLINGPAVIVVLIVAFTASGFGGFFFISKIRADIIKFLAPILSTVLSTDNAGYTETNLNTVGQCCAILIFFLHQISEKYFSKKHLESSIENKWFEAIEEVSNYGDSENLSDEAKTEKLLFEGNSTEIQKILRKQVLRNDLASSSKVKSYELLTKKMSLKDRNSENEILIKELIGE